MNRVLVLASGGMDSTVLMANYKRLNYDVKVMFFNYGQAGYQQEHYSLINNMVKLGMHKEDIIEMRIDVPWSSSSTLKANNSTDGAPLAVYVEMRNLIFASYALSYCESLGIDTLALGYIDTEGVSYADTSENFVQDLRDLANRAIGVRVDVPFMYLNKLDVARLGVDLGVDVLGTFSCNTPIDGQPCGICGDCKEIEKIKLSLKNK